MHLVWEELDVHSILYLHMLKIYICIYANAFICRKLLSRAVFADMPDLHIMSKKTHVNRCYILRQSIIYIEGAKEKYRGVFEIQRSGDKTSSGKIGLDIRTHASPKVGQDQVSRGVSVLCWHAAPVAYVLWKSI